MGCEFNARLLWSLLAQLYSPAVFLWAASKVQSRFLPRVHEGQCYFYLDILILIHSRLSSSSSLSLTHMHTHAQDTPMHAQTHPQD